MRWCLSDNKRLPISTQDLLCYFAPNYLLGRKLSAKGAYDRDERQAWLPDGVAGSDAHRKRSHSVELCCPHPASPWCRSLGATACFDLGSVCIDGRLHRHHCLCCRAF